MICGMRILGRSFFLWLVLAAVLTAHADLATEPWPKVAGEFPHEIPRTLTLGDFRITISETTDPEIRQLGGSGGPMMTFTVQKVKNGWKQVFYGQCVGTRWLAPFEGRPQLEIWGRGGGGSYSRSLIRFVHGKYRRIRTDEFTVFRESATQPSITTTLPRGDEALYFVETRMPEGAEGDLRYEDEK